MCIFKMENWSHLSEMVRSIGIRLLMITNKKSHRLRLFTCCKRNFIGCSAFFLATNRKQLVQQSS